MKKGRADKDTQLIDNDISYHESKIAEHQKRIDDLKHQRNILEIKKKWK